MIPPRRCSPTCARLQHIDDDGYLQLAADTRAAVQDIRAGVLDVPGLRMLGEPDSTLLAVAADEDAGFDPFTVADEMRELLVEFLGELYRS